MDFGVVAIRVPMSVRRVFLLVGLVIAGAPAPATPASEENSQHNVMIYVADGLRSAMVNDQTAPNIARLAREGVRLVNSHSLFPTLTMTNASALATGHAIGDTGTFGNTIDVGFEVPSVGNTVTPFLENDAVLADVDEHFAGNYLGEASLLELARAKGYSTASIGKVGPTLLFDHTERTGLSIVIDDYTGTPKGIPLAPEVTERLTAVGLPVVAPSRGANGTSPTLSANDVQQDFFASAATRVVLPLFASQRRPFILVFWSRDPDGTQHYQGDSLQKLTPGINGPTSLAAIRNADDDLGRILAALGERGLTQTTDIVVVSDHGFSTISKQSITSPSAKLSYAGVPAGFLPPGFLAIDLAKKLDLSLLDPDNADAPVSDGTFPKYDNGLIGSDKEHPKVVVAANGGSDLIYIPDGDQAMAEKVVNILLAQDYVSGIFVDSRLGTFSGTLPLSDVMLDGSALTPMPAIVVSFRSFDTVCGEPPRSAVEVADTVLQQGQGMHGSFSRADTWNFMALAGPDFKSRFVDTAPASNADVARTVAAVMHLDIRDRGKLSGRVLGEAMLGGTIPDVESMVLVSDHAYNGLQTVVNLQRVGDSRYIDAAGFPGRTVGLAPRDLDSGDPSPPSVGAATETGIRGLASPH
jgi:hypothetical protein